ncbi:M23 family metallopeptidase [Citrobacter freundii]|uniref:M23 family metallopeptidase n=1 Tax=Citrobacter freundii TaxID=546 RepID=UPI0019082BED|nr:M23 family metallopeptidase [Citrobacter freundii]MBJ8931617.1 M23 family metallopeptidase [Citrobacter freundii]
MISPTAKEVVSGRFGKARGGGAGNFGSANQKPHMHDGLDFSTSGASVPVNSATDGVVVYSGARGSAGNAVLIKRDNGDIVAFYHLSGINVKVGQSVKAGEAVGVSGNTPTTNMVKHLHLTYGTADKNDAKAKAFDPKMLSRSFDPSSLSNTVKFQNGIGYKTDPSPYFCDTYVIQDGHPEDSKVLGADTKAQYEILFGSVPENGVRPDTDGLDGVQVASSNADAALANSEGKNIDDMIGPTGTFGSLPEPPIGEYSVMSVNEMMETEAFRRFTDSNWNNELTSASPRALLMDYVRAVGVENYLDVALSKKKERIESLLATYTSLKSKEIKEQVLRDAQNAERNHVNISIK